VELRESPECDQRIDNDDRGNAGGPGAEDCHGASARGFFGKVVTIDMLTRERDEQASLAYLSRVRTDVEGKSFRIDPVDWKTVYGCHYVS
jgi:hypothetical protein